MCCVHTGAHTSPPFAAAPRGLAGPQPRQRRAHGAHLPCGRSACRGAQCNGGAFRRPPRVHRMHAERRAHSDVDGSGCHTGRGSAARGSRSRFRASHVSLMDFHASDPARGPARLDVLHGSQVSSCPSDLRGRLLKFGRCGDCSAQRGCRTDSGEPYLTAASSEGCSAAGALSAARARPCR